MSDRLTSIACRDVVDERYRQISAEGFDGEHDQQYAKGELILAAVSYASHALLVSQPEMPILPPVPATWPWDPNWWKPHDRRRDLVRAAALIIAEIERFDHAEGRR